MRVMMKLSTINEYESLIQDIITLPSILKTKGTHFIQLCLVALRKIVETRKPPFFDIEE